MMVQLIGAESLLVRMYQSFFGISTNEICYKVDRLTMRVRTAGQRYQEKFETAKNKVLSAELSIRKVAAKYRVPASTLHLHVKRAREGIPLKRGGRSLSFTTAEESVVGNTLLHFADRTS